MPLLCRIVKMNMDPLVCELHKTICTDVNINHEIAETAVSSKHQEPYAARTRATRMSGETKKRPGKWIALDKRVYQYNACTTAGTLHTESVKIRTV